MNILQTIITILLVSAQLTNCQDDVAKNKAIFFQKMMARRREEHLVLQKNLMSFSYEKKIKLLDIAIKKLYELIDENKKKLEGEESKKKETERQIAESIILENVCLLSDFILNFNDMTYEVLKRLKFDAIGQLRWGLDFTSKYSSYFDPITDKELKYISDNLEKIRNQEPLENPFENNLKKMFQQPEAVPTTPKPKKKRKVLKKGPRLTSFGEL